MRCASLVGRHAAAGHGSRRDRAGKRLPTLRLSGSLGRNAKTLFLPAPALPSPPPPPRARRYVFPLAQRYGSNFTTYRIVPLANNDQILRAVVSAAQQAPRHASQRGGHALAGTRASLPACAQRAHCEHAPPFRLRTPAVCPRSRRVWDCSMPGTRPSPKPLSGLNWSTSPRDGERGGRLPPPPGGASRKRKRPRTSGPPFVRASECLAMVPPPRHPTTARSQV